MPIQYAQVLQQLREKLPRLVTRREERQELVEAARQVFEQWKSRPEMLRERVEEAVRKDPNLRSGAPLDDVPALDAVVPPPPLPAPESLALLASDGSHVMPDRHRSLFYGVVNVAVFLLTYRDSWKVVETRVFLEDDFPPYLAPESYVRMERTVREHALLAQVAVQVLGGQRSAVSGQPSAVGNRLTADHRRLTTDRRPLPLLDESCEMVALVDGPLEIWGVAEQEYRLLVRRLSAHWDALRQGRLPLAGYVDRPRADLVVQMLAIAQGHTDARRPLWPGVLDAHLYLPLLQPGWRSPLFRIYSAGMQGFPQDHKVCFFYMHVGTESRPLLARVEIPAWVAREPRLVQNVHRALWVSLNWSGSARYPYPLHRAHQEAVVTYKDREEFEGLLQRFWMEQGLALSGPSEKQRLKNRDRRT